ncbi:hypothetical protein EBX31_04340, partial [bacterium]|nr:hypothetical protein [bacterium]
NLIGYNWEYRLVFLLFCLPAIGLLRERHAAWFALGFSLIASLCWQTFFAQVFSQWLGETSRFYYLTDVANILLFVYLSSFLLSCWRHEGKQPASWFARQPLPS